MKKSVIVFLVLMFSAFFLVGCNKVDNSSIGKVDNSSIANPASEYCVKQGNKLDIIKDAAGNEYGVCKFSDGTECEEWDYFRGNCKQGDTKIAVPINKAQCESEGGKWDKVGLGQVERCNLPTKDSTKSCTDGSQCQAGVCIQEDNSSSGQCPAWRINFGCMKIMEDGKPMKICID